MTTSPFTITEYVIDGQHIREYPHATKTGDDVMKLAVKRYTPKSNPNPQPGDVTIIGAHGSGFPKEIYESIWEETLFRLNAQGLQVRSIWIADGASQSASGVMNEEILGNDPSWFDHARDLLFLINHFKADMPRPIVGVGHSLGAGQLALLSLLHPRLFTSLVLMEPVIEPDSVTGKGPIFVSLSLNRKDSWPSRSEAAKYFKKAYNKWDPRALESYVKHGLREDLTKADGSVMLTTSKHQEVIQYMRPNFQHKRVLDADADPESLKTHDTVFYPDIIGPSNAIYPFYRYEPILLFKLLEHIRPSVLYLFGETSPISTPDHRKEKMERTGRGVGGSGGYETGRVKEVIFPGAGHALPFEAVEGVSDAVATWLKQEVIRWKEEEERIKTNWVDLQRKARTSTSNEWPVQLKTYFDKPKKTGSKL